MGAAFHHNATAPLRVPRFREGFWEIIQKLADTRGEFSVADIDDASNVNASHIRQYMRALTAGGFIAVVRREIRHNAPGVPVYRLVKRQREAPRLRADGSALITATDQLWTTMRNLPSFTVKELAFAATTDKPISRRCAQLFVNRLLTAGYLTEANGAYRLKPKMNTGPKPPQRLRICAHVMFDQNTKAIVGDMTAEVTE